MHIFRSESVIRCLIENFERKETFAILNTKYHLIICDCFLLDGGTLISIILVRYREKTNVVWRISCVSFRRNSVEEADEHNFIIRHVENVI